MRCKKGDLAYVLDNPDLPLDKRFLIGCPVICLQYIGSIQSPSKYEDFWLIEIGDGRKAYASDSVLLPFRPGNQSTTTKKEKPKELEHA